jgi:hypothetical protein
MKRKKNISLAVLILLLSFNSEAQNLPSFYPFKGFHIGITGQAEYIQKCSFLPLIGPDPAPKPQWTYGWEAGIEFSYHFVKYLGISFGINYGTILSFNHAIFLSTVPDFQGGWEEVNKYESFLNAVYNCEPLFPIKLEFHYPINKNLFFNTEIGVKIKGIRPKIIYEIIEYGRSFAYIIDLPSSSSSNFEQIMYYEDLGWRYMSKIHCDLLIGLGLYYQLPYGDLLRFNFGANVSFKPIIEGYYRYFLTNSYGTYSVKNDFLYTQLSYIHTFNWEKAKKYVKKQEYSFSSKKERRGKILELLNAW